MTKKLFICATVLLLNTQNNSAMFSKKQQKLQKEAAAARIAQQQKATVTLPPVAQEETPTRTSNAQEPLNEPMFGPEPADDLYTEPTTDETQTPPAAQEADFESVIQPSKENSKFVFESGYLSEDDTETGTAQESRGLFGRVFANKFTHLTSESFTVAKGHEQLAVRDYNRVLQDELLATLTALNQEAITSESSRKDLYYMRETLDVNYSVLNQCKVLLDAADRNHVAVSPVLLKAVKDQMNTHNNTLRHIEKIQKENNEKQSFNSQELLRKKHPVKVATFIKYLAQNKGDLSEAEIDKAGRLVNRTLDTILSSQDKEGLECLQALMEANGNEFQVSDTKKQKIEEYLSNLEHQFKKEDGDLLQELEALQTKIALTQEIVSSKK